MARLPFKRVFIANRGEICRRIATSAGALGIESVALCSVEPPPLYMRQVVTTILTIPESEDNPRLYLNPEAMIAHAKAAGCDSLHPGFGFLSENAAFAAAVEKAGLTWIGPPPSAIAAMADKSAARQTAEKHQVPCTRGMRLPNAQELDGKTQAALQNFAATTPYPLLIKAALGGGGKGMRLIHSEADLDDAIPKAYSEALHSFGDGSLLIEQYIARSRHIEVQILADRHGQVFAIGDRDCSLQRRHQKVLEEAPAPGLHPSTRLALHAAAVRLAKAVGYTSAGTVEFLLDSRASQEALQPFYFLEMNTRLQVEHPVTEEVFGLDLVAWQFAVAAGARLPAHFEALQPRGHSIEARLYGEDIHNNFFPSPGDITAFQPHHGLGIRWEIGLDLVDSISSRFDPMIAKLVATGETREQALGRMADALRRTFLVGPANNKEFLLSLVSATAFKEGPCDTHFIGDHLAEIQAQISRERARHQEEADKALAWLTDNISLQASGGQSHGRAPSIASISQHAFAAESSALFLQAGKPAESTSFEVSEQHLHTPAWGRAPLRYGQILDRSRANFVSLPFVVSKVNEKGGRKTIFAVLKHGYEYTFIKEKRGWQGQGSAAAREGDLIAPVPGKVVKIKAQLGDLVRKDDSLFVLESMKMEFDVRATTAGKVVEINVQEGQQLTSGTVLAIIEP